MIVRSKDGIIVLGVTGKQGTFWTEKMIAYGTNVVAGVNPKRAGETHVGVPILASPSDAVAKTGGDVAVMFIPPPMAKDAAVSAAEAGIKLLVVLTEHIPAQDVMAIHAAAARHGTRIVGPNTAGLVTPRECFVGIMPAFAPSVFKSAPDGVISHTSSLGPLLCLNLTRDALEALDRDAGTDAVVIVGEIGGAMEESAAEYAKTMYKPMVAFIAGAAAPPGKKMGHAGAIVTGNAGSYASKRKALEASGVTVVDTPSQIAAAVAAGLQSGRPKVAASQ